MFFAKYGLVLVQLHSLGFLKALIVWQAQCLMK